MSETDSAGPQGVAVKPGTTVEPGKAAAPETEKPVAAPAGIGGSTPHGDPVHVDGVEGAQEPVVEFAEPPNRAEAPRYEGPMPGQVDRAEGDDAEEDPLAGLRGVGNPVGIVERSPELHAALITGEAQAGHQYPHNRP